MERGVGGWGDYVLSPGRFWGGVIPFCLLYSSSVQGKGGLSQQVILAQCSVVPWLSFPTVVGTTLFYTVVPWLSFPAVVRATLFYTVLHCFTLFCTVLQTLCYTLMCLCNDPTREVENTHQLASVTLRCWSHDLLYGHSPTMRGSWRVSDVCDCCAACTRIHSSAQRGGFQLSAPL